MGYVVVKHMAVKFVGVGLNPSRFISSFTLYPKKLAQTGHFENARDALSVL